MKKKLALLLSIMFVFSLVFAGCGKDPKKVDYNGVTYDELSATSKAMVEALSQMSEDDMAYYLANADDLTKTIMSAWSENTADLGEYKGCGEFSVNKAGSTLTTDMTVQFEERNVIFELVYNYNDMSMPTGVTVEPIQTLGEKMSKAGMNTLISMSVVFGVLILISFIIYAFNIFPYLEKKKKEKQQAAVAAAATAPAPSQPVASPAVVPAEQGQMDDTELVAVISAAIAAYEGTSVSGFVVRSINRR